MRLFFRYFFRTLRVILGPFMMLSERLTTPKGIERDPETQKTIDEQSKDLTLYQFATCPFCIKVRREMKRLSLNIELRDAQRDPEARAELEQGGGEIKVPCLRITNEHGSHSWLYESDDIIAYLRERFAG
ncbi:MAG: glutaredoxin [Gammaproteobacteria bacterium]|nr:glutaredoxin [Gammaproteobacteria bacterium]